MYPISDTLKQLFLNGNKKCCKLTLNNATTEEVITEADILSDSLTVDRYCSSGNKIEVGSAIAAELTLTLLNNNDKFNHITFEGSEVSLEIGIDGVEDSYIPCGKFTIDEPPRSSLHIKLRALDFMMLFDKKVDANDVQEIDTVGNLLVKCCEVCNVDLWDEVAIKSLPNYNQTIKVPTTDITYRQIVQWIAQLTGTCAFMDWEGKLRLSWFKDSGVVLDPTNRYIGGTLDENNITIKGVCIKTQNTVVTTEDSVNPIVIESNQLLYSDDKTYLETIANNIATGIGALTYRPFQCNTIPMPFLYPLDIVGYEGVAEGDFSTVITNHNFGLNKASALSAVGETATQSGYSSVKGLTKAEIDSAIREAMKGVDAKAEHIHIMYSAYEKGLDASGKASMSDKPDATTEYLGTCATNSTSPPDTPSSYKWVKIRGADGSNGKDGQDGKDGKDGKGISEVINYYLTTDKADGVTRDDFGGNTEFVTPDKDKPYLWNYEEIRYTSGNPTYTAPCIIGNFAENGSSGRGIKSITEYYFTTQTESTPLKSSFKDTVQTPTETLPFLWNYEKIEYTDDSKPYESDVRLIGVYGSDGKSLFTWVKYADDASGTNMSDNATGKKYMGIAYNKTSATESTTASDYTWSKIQGDNGRGVSKVATEYYLSTSETTQTGGSWSENAPEWVEGRYLWTRLATTYTDGKTEYSDPVVDASWKKTSVVDAASKELNETLANALGLHVTEQSGVRYYHSNPSLSASGVGDTIIVFNASGFGVCKSGWNGGNPIFSYGTTFDGKAVWDILVANKISADLIEAGVLSSRNTSSLQTSLDLATGILRFIFPEGQVTAKGFTPGGESDLTEEQNEELKWLSLNRFPGVHMDMNTPDTNVCAYYTPAGVMIGEVSAVEAIASYAVNYFKYESGKGAKPDAPPDFSVSEIGADYISSREVRSSNLIYISRAGKEKKVKDLDSLVSNLSIECENLSTSLSALQQKYTELLEEIGKACEHSGTITRQENMVAATCTSQGSYDDVVYCSACGDELSRAKRYTPIISHSYSSVVEKRPDCTNSGTRRYTCSECGTSYTEPISATGHKDNDGNGICDACGVEVGTFYTISVDVSPAGGGTVTGAGRYLNGSTATLTATANPGYSFAGWYQGTTKLDSATIYSFKVASTETVVAKFEAKEQHMTASINAENAGANDVVRLAKNADGTESWGKTQFSEGDVVYFYAKSNSGKVINRVVVTNAFGTSEFSAQEMAEMLNAEKTELSFKFNVTAFWLNTEYSMTVHFEDGESVQVEIMIDINLPEKGNISVACNGRTIATSSGTYMFSTGDVVTLTATPVSGQSFLYWFEGSSPWTQISFDNPYTFTVTTETPKRIRAGF